MGRFHTSWQEPEDLPNDADELRAEDRARSRVCHHRSGDPDCECHPETEEEKD